MDRQDMEEGKKKEGFEDYEDHLIVCGYGNVGRTVTQQLLLWNEDVVVVEENEQELEKGNQEIDYVVGDATREEVLEKAGVSNARGLFAVLPKDSDNILLSLSAKDFNEDIRILAKADSSDSEKHLRRAGVEDVVLPDKEGGIRMARSFLHPEITSLYDHLLMGDVGRAGSVVVQVGKAMDGKTIEEAKIRKDTGASIVGIKRGDELITNPKIDERIEGGDTLIVVGTLSEIEKVRELASMDEIPEKDKDETG